MIARFAGTTPREARVRRPLGFAARSGTRLVWVAAGLALHAAAAPAQGPAGSESSTGSYPMHSGVSPPFARIGEQVTYHGWIAVERFTAVTWAAPDTGGNFTWGALRGGRSPLTTRRPGGPWPADSVWAEAPLQAFATGQLAVPGLGFTLDRHDGSTYAGRLPAVRLGVPSDIAPNDTTADLRPPRGPLRAPWWERVPWRLVAAVAGLVALAIVVLRRPRRRRPVATAPAAARRRDPAAEARSDLAALRRMMLLEAGKFDEHALRLSHILRRYLEATLGALRPGDSTPELLRRLEAGLLVPQDVERLRQLLRRWDGIKFARFPSDAEEGRRCEEAVRELILRRSRSARSEVA